MAECCQCGAITVDPVIVQYGGTSPPDTFCSERCHARSRMSPDEREVADLREERDALAARAAALENDLRAYESDYYMSGCTCHPRGSGAHIRHEDTCARMIPQERLAARVAELEVEVERLRAVLRGANAFLPTHRHYRGGDYQMLYVARECTNSRDRRRVVVYRSADGSVFTRDISEWKEQIDEHGTPRFAALGGDADA